MLTLPRRLESLAVPSLAPILRPNLLDISTVDDWLPVRAMGDQHHGSGGHTAEHYRRDLEEIRDRRGAVILMGDAIEAIHVADKRFSPGSVQGPPSQSDLGDLIPQQFLEAEAALECVRGRIIGAILGNHEGVFVSRFGLRSLYYQHCQRLETQPLGRAALLELRIWFRDPGGKRRKRGVPPERTIRIVAHHGAGGAITAGGKLNRALQWARSWEGVDIVLWAHSHAEAVYVLPRLTGSPDCSTLDARQMLVLLTGSYVQTYQPGLFPSYGESNAYEPTAIGSPILLLGPERGMQKVEVAA